MSDPTNDPARTSDPTRTGGEAGAAERYASYRRD